MRGGHAAGRTVPGLTWKAQSTFTDPGAASSVIDELPADLAVDPGSVAGQDAALLDEVCAHLAGSGVSPCVVAALAGRDELRVPATVTSFDPYGGPPREVTLRP